MEQTPQVDPTALSLSRAIRATEGGDYNNTRGDNGTSAGAYQWNNGKVPLQKGQTPLNFQSAAKQFNLDPNDFSPTNQDHVAYEQIKHDLDSGLTQSQIAAKWNSGLTHGWENHKGTTVINGKTISYDTPGYVAKVQKYYQQDAANFKPGVAAAPTSTNDPSQVGQALVGKKPPKGNITDLPEQLASFGNTLLPAIGDVYHDIKGDSQKTALQQAGDVGTTALTAASVIPGVDLLDLGALGGKAALKEAPSLAAKLTRGGFIGGGYGASGSLGSGETDPTKIALASGEGAVLGGATEGLLEKVLPGSTVNKSVQDTMPLANKSTRIAALEDSLPGSKNGGVTRKGMLGESFIQPNEQDVARGTIADQFIGKTNDPVKKIQNINQGIEDASAQTNEFLDKNAVPANFADMRDYVESNNIPDRNLQKDPTAFENYQRATQGGLDTLAEVMSKVSKETGDYGPRVSGANIRKARIAVDAQIKKELGESTFGTPQYKGIKAAEIGLRNTLNRLGEDLLRYPGQLAQVNRLNGFISASRARGIEVDMNNPQVRAQLEKQFGLHATPQAESNAQVLNQAHQSMSHLYDARDNLINKYERNVGNTRLGEAVQKSPVAKGLLNVVKKAIPFGIGEHVL